MNTSVIIKIIIAITIAIIIYFVYNKSNENKFTPENKTRIKTISMKKLQSMPDSHLRTYEILRRVDEEIVRRRAADQSVSIKDPNEIVAQFNQLNILENTSTTIYQLMTYMPSLSDDMLAGSSSPSEGVSQIL